MEFESVMHGYNCEQNHQTRLFMFSTFPTVNHLKSSATVHYFNDIYVYYNSAGCFMTMSELENDDFHLLDH